MKCEQEGQKEGLVGESNKDMGPLDPATTEMGPFDPNWKTSNASRRAGKKV